MIRQSGYKLRPALYFSLWFTYDHYDNCDHWKKKLSDPSNCWFPKWSLRSLWIQSLRSKWRTKFAPFVKFNMVAVNRRLLWWDAVFQDGVAEIVYIRKLLNSVLYFSAVLGYSQFTVNFGICDGQEKAKSLTASIFFIMLFLTVILRFDMAISFMSWLRRIRQ